MKTMTTTFVLGAFILFSIPLYTLAQTYAYVDKSGSLQLEAADDPQDAINDAPNRAVHSGVMTVSDAQASTIVPKDPDTEVYAYVDISGNLQTQIAESSDEAISEAPNRAVHSGVMLVAK